MGGFFYFIYLGAPRPGLIQEAWPGLAFQAACKI